MPMDIAAATEKLEHWKKESRELHLVELGAGYEINLGPGDLLRFDSELRFKSGTSIAVVNLDDAKYVFEESAAKLPRMSVESNTSPSAIWITLPRHARFVVFGFPRAAGAGMKTQGI